MPRALALAAALSATAAAAALAQQPARADSASRDTAYALPTLTVTRAPEPLARVPAAADVVDRDAIRKAQLTSGLDESLANVPGIYVTNRYNYSQDQRISIRGAGSRTSFGVRGIKILLDGVPQTLPDGQSQLTNVDFGLLDRIEVLKGASSSLYGNASGGVLDLRSEQAGPEPFTQRVRGEYGSYGLDKWQSVTTARSGPLAGLLSVSRLTSTGFRQQSYTDLRQLNASVVYALSGNTSLAFRASAADGPFAGNPGALTPAEYAANRDSAAGNNILRRADKAVTQQQGSLALRHVDDRGNEYQVTVFGLLRDLTNPLATPPPAPPAVTPTSGTLVQIGRAAGGARASASYQLGESAWLPRVTVGADVQRLRDNRTNERSNAGVSTGVLLLDQREKVTEVGPFAQLAWTPTEKLFIGAGSRYDRVTFDVLDRFLSDGDASGSRTMAAWSGNAGVSYGVHPLFTPYANVGTAFETPTTTELANKPNGGGGFNDLLNPQRTTSVEAGARGQSGRVLSYTVAVFRASVRDALIQYREVGGRAYFTNAGRTRNDGLELGLSVAPIPAVRVFGSYTYAHYIFRDYTIVNGTTSTSYAGNRLAGIPKHFLRLGLRTSPGHGLSIDIDHTFSSSLYADDANTQLVNGWGNGVMNARASWQGTTGDIAVAPFLGVNNVFNRAYVGSVVVNGTFNRVLEPSPLRNVYAGAEIGFKARRH